VDKQPFPINTMELQQPKVLVWSHQVEATKGKNMLVREAKPDLRGKELTRQECGIHELLAFSWYYLNLVFVHLDQSTPCLNNPS
jgi:hypothetical protein